MISRQHKIVMSLIIFQTFSHNVLRFSKSDVFLHSRYATKEPIHVMPAHTAFPSLSFSKFRVTCIHTYIYIHISKPRSTHACSHTAAVVLGRSYFVFCHLPFSQNAFPKIDIVLMVQRHGLSWRRRVIAGLIPSTKKKKRMNFYTFTPLLVKDFKKTRTKSRLFVRLLSF